MMHSDLEEYVRALFLLNRDGRREEALHSLINTSLSLTERESAFGRIFGSRELDRIAATIGARRKIRLGARKRSGIVIIATALYGRGGHTRSLADLIAAEPEHTATVLLTNVGHDLAQREIEAILPVNVAFEIAPVEGLAHRLQWLQLRLANLRPKRTYLFHHPYDAVAVAAAQPDLVGELYFYHHADHGFTLGLHTPAHGHIDPTPKIFWHCREQEGQVNNVYWPLTGGKEADGRRLPTRRQARRLVTCCSGGMEKFQSVSMIDQLPYRPTYPQAVATTLAVTKGRHIHIGPLSDATLREIKDKLEAAGLSTRNFIHHREVSSIAETLVRQGVDLYMGSFPRGGGRALIEAMSVGLPLLLHSSYRSELLCDVNEAYEGALSWRTLDDLKSALATITPALLQDHACRARSTFLERHTWTRFEHAVAETLAGRSPQAPAALKHDTDPLQNYYDEQNKITLLGTTADLLALMRERNEGWKSLGGIRIDDALGEDPLHHGVLPSNRGLYLHAGSNRNITLARISPEEGRDVSGMRAQLKMPDERSPSLEFAVVTLARETTPDLQKLASKMSGGIPPSSDQDFTILVPWRSKETAETETLIADWRDKNSARDVVILVRTSLDAASHRYAMLSFGNIEWLTASTAATPRSQRLHMDVAQ